MKRWIRYVFPSLTHSGEPANDDDDDYDCDYDYDGRTWPTIITIIITILNSLGRTHTELMFCFVLLILSSLSCFVYLRIILSFFFCEVKIWRKRMAKDSKSLVIKRETFFSFCFVKAHKHERSGFLLRLNSQISLYK